MAEQAHLRFMQRRVDKENLFAIFTPMSSR